MSTCYVWVWFFFFFFFFWQNWEEYFGSVLIIFFNVCNYEWDIGAFVSFLEKKKLNFRCWHLQPFLRYFCLSRWISSSWHLLFILFPLFILFSFFMFKSCFTIVSIHCAILNRILHFVWERRHNVKFRYWWVPIFLQNKFIILVSSLIKLCRKRSWFFFNSMVKFINGCMLSRLKFF